MIKPNSIETSYIIVTVAFFCMNCGIIYRRVNSILNSIQKVMFVEYVGIAMLCVCAIYMGVAAMMISFTTAQNVTACSISIFACLFLYAGTKLMLYMFLIEKVHMVNCAFNKFTKRYDSFVYKINIFLLMIPYLGILILMIIYRIALIDDDGNCRIGLHEPSSYPLLIYDTIYRIYLMSLFLYPIYGSLTDSPKIMAMAKKNLFGTMISTLFSFGNILSIILAHGMQHSFTCLFYCVIDVFANVMIMNWLLTTPRDKVSPNAVYSVPSSNASKNNVLTKTGSVVKNEENDKLNNINTHNNIANGEQNA